MNKDSYQQIKKFADFQSDCKDFDAKLEELQESLYPTSHKNDYDFDVYIKAGIVRDTLFRLVRCMRGFPDEISAYDFDCGGGEVVRTRE